MNPSENQIPATNPVSPTPEIPPVKPNPASNTLVLLLVALCLILAGVSGYEGYLIYKMQTHSTPTVSPTPTATPDPTTDWKTYTNTNLDVSMKYPADIFTYSASPESDSQYWANENAGAPLEMDKNGVWMNLSVQKITTNLPDSIATEGKWTVTHQDPKPNTEVSYSYHAKQIKDGHLYDLFIATFDDKLLANYKDTFDQILSTFKFININTSTDISNWKSFSYDNFALKLPNGWVANQSTNNGNSFWTFTTNTPNKNEVIVSKLTSNLVETKNEILALFSTPPTIKTVSLEGSSATEYYGCAGVEGCVNEYILATIFKGSTYKIDFPVNSDQDNTLYNNFISTFKFTN